MENIKKMIGLIPANASEYARKTYKIGIFGVKNNFVLAGILLIGYCVIAPAVYITRTIDSSVSMNVMQIIMCLYSVIAAYVGGILIPAVMFAYVHKRRDRDFYHSMPVKRGQYFIGYLAAGFVMFAAPYLMMCIIMGLLSGYWVIAFSYVIHAIALYIVIYATTTFSMMFSGSLLSSAVTLAFLNAFPAIVTYCSLIINPVVDVNAYYTLLTPYVFIFTPMSGGYIVIDHLLNKGVFGWVLWVQLAIAVIELVLAYIMYKYRKGETTMAVAFPKTRYILQYGVMFLVALFCSSAFNSVYFASASARTQVRIETVIWTVIFTFATFVVMNMILEKNFRAAFHKIQHLAIFAGVYVVIVALIIGIVGCLPRWVVPIKTDAILISQRHYLSTYDKPDDEQQSHTIFLPDGSSYTYSNDYWEASSDENGRYVYHVELDSKYYAVTDPKQVAELTKRINDCMNNPEREIKGYMHYIDNEGEYYDITFYLYTLKPGEKITAGMYLDDISYIYSQYYRDGSGYFSASEMESFISGLDMMEMYYKYW